MKRIIFAAALLLSACSLAPQTAPQAAYEGSASFVVALKGANAYASMPRCSVTVKAPCSDQATVNRIVDKANTAQIAVLASQNIAKDTASADTDIEKANAAMRDAVAALVQITPKQ